MPEWVVFAVEQPSEQGVAPIWGSVVVVDAPGPRDACQLVADLGQRPGEHHYVALPVLPTNAFALAAGEQPG